MKKLLCAILSVLMLLSVFSITASAYSGPVRISITTAGNDQRCTKSSTVDPLGRTVQQIHPMDSASSLAPAYFSTSNATGIYASTKEERQDPSIRALKFVVYSSKASTQTAKLLVWAYTDKMATRTAVTAEGGTKIGAGWTTLYFDLTKSNFAADEYLHAFMLNMFGNEAANAHLDDTLYIGYIGLFDTLANAQAYTSDFEGALNFNGVKVGTTNYSYTQGGSVNYDLGGASTLPTVSLTGTGDANGLSVNYTELASDGTATATIKQDSVTLFTVNFTGGAAATGVEPLELVATWAGAKDQRCTRQQPVDPFGRTVNTYLPVLTYVVDNGNGSYSDLETSGTVSPGGQVPTASVSADYTVAKLVYRSTDTYTPKFQAFKTFSDSANLSATDASAKTANQWHTVYYNISAKAPVAYFMVNFTSDTVQNHPDGKYEIGYLGLFGSIVDAQEHVSIFEGPFTVSDVKLGGTSIGNVTTYNRNLNGATAVPALTVTAVGDASNVVITNGTISADGTATSTVKDGSTTLVTVNFTGGTTVFAITGISYDGTALAFDPATTVYNVDMPYGATMPTVAYTHSGEDDPNVTVTTTAVAGVGYKSEIKDGDTVLYTINFNVAQTKPQGLINSLYKLKVDKKLTVGYFGGSVTAGTGSSSANSKSWRALTRDWLKSTFPAASITEKNAAIGGTGAIFGVFRADSQYIGTKAPDLNFIEMCVNDSYDGTYNKNEQYVYIESMVKKIYASNPKADIIFLIVGDNSKMKDEAINNTTNYGKPYADIGAYYDIPVLYIGQRLARKIYLENGNVFPGSSDAAWTKYFSDTVHLNDTGYAEYASYIEEYLEENLPTAYTPAASEYIDKLNPATAYCPTNGKGDLMLDATMVAPISSTFPKTYLGGFTQTSNAMTDNTAGHVASFTFNAQNIGIWTWSYADGTDIIYSIDGGAEKAVQLYRSFANHKCYMLGQNLGAGTHTIRIFHNDANTMDIRQFLFWGINGSSVSIQPVPYLNMSTADVSMSDRDVFSFSGSTHSYTVPVSNVSGGSIVYPTVNFEAPDGYYGYKLTQAKGANNAATLLVDNVGTYTFTFVKSAFTPERNVGAGYIAETIGATDRTYGVLAGVRLADWVDLSKVRSIGFYGFLADSNTPVVKMSSAAKLATLADYENRFYSMIYDIASINENVIVKPFVVIDGETYTDSALTVVPSALNANDTYYGPLAAVKAFFFDGSIVNGLFNPQNATDLQTAQNYMADHGENAGIARYED